MRRAVGLASWITLGFVGVLIIEAIVALRGDYVLDEQFVIADTVEPQLPAPGSSDAEPFRLWVLGDSTAAGLGAADEASTLPALIAQRVADATGRRVAVTGLGVSGARTDTVTNAQVPQLPGDEVDAVVVVVGANDVTHVTPPWAIGPRTQQMLSAVVAQTGAPVVLGGIPRFSGIDAVLEPLRSITDRYAAVLRRRQRLAAEAVAGEPSAITYVNIAVEASPRFRGVPESMSSDGFHPSSVGYGYWADALAPPVVAIARSS